MITQHREQTKTGKQNLLLRLLGGLIVLMGLLAAFSILAVVQFVRTLCALSADYESWLRLIMPLAVLLLWLSVWWSWLGIGVMRAREWARRLLLISSRLWLVGGGIIVIWLAWVQQGWQLAPVAVDVFVDHAQQVLFGLRLGLPLLALLLGVLLPAFLQLAFGRRSAQLGFVSPGKNGWLKELSSAQLALLLMQLTTAVLFPLSLSFLEFVPLAGFLLTGVAGWIAMLLFSVLQLLLAAGVYHGCHWALLGTRWMTYALAVNTLVYAIVLKLQEPHPVLPKGGWTFLLLTGLIYAVLMLGCQYRIQAGSLSQQEKP